MSESDKPDLTDLMALAVEEADRRGLRYNTRCKLCGWTLDNARLADIVDHDDKCHGDDPILEAYPEKVNELIQLLATEEAND
jgi:hypothetical protein